METATQLVSFNFLRRVWADDYERYCQSNDDEAVLCALKEWASRSKKKETSDETAFIRKFFVNIWDYRLNGEGDGYTIHPKHTVSQAGAKGNAGLADAALGWFDLPDVPPVPIALCEFKDIRSNLDVPQKRKNDKRSPVKQCAEYLREAGRQFYGHEKFQPLWGFVSDMNEFRLYWRNTIPSQFQRFVLERTGLFDTGISLLEGGEKARFHRYVFKRLFHADTLLTRPDGQNPLLRLLKEQGQSEKDLENVFYREYRDYRVHLYNELLLSNPGWKGTRSALVRLAQKILDRCLFVIFCEDMGRQLSFPPALLTDFLSGYSLDRYYDSEGQEVWEKLKKLFTAMDTGGPFGSETLNRFNGGLFRPDHELDKLRLPNKVFCEKMQAENDEALKAHKQTLLYLSKTYNFGIKAGGEKSITLYTLGRIFEQSITELEKLEAEADERVSLTVISKRKTDGVYYTPEWVVARIVDETIGARLAELRREAEWDDSDPVPDAKDKAARIALQDKLQNYLERLGELRVVDPACGSGAFLIHALEYLLAERQRVKAILSEVGTLTQAELDTEAEIRLILSQNIYGVDINPASVEIARLALWLHTARADRPLCDLDQNIVEGNSLVGTDFYGNRQTGDLFNAEQRDVINAFDWGKVFPAIFERGGFDCVIGNPPYVKLQNLKKVSLSVTNWLKNAKQNNGEPLYASTQSGNYDLFLPFIERGLLLLREHGRLGYIAPSLWLKNEYGKGLRNLVRRGRHLERWIDFRDFQVFEEAITYTALQFYNKSSCDEIRFAFSPDGQVGGIDWAVPDGSVRYAALPNEGAWVFAPKKEKALLDKLEATCDRLDSEHLTTSIFQGLITSADNIYHLKRLGPNRYQTRAGAEAAIEDAIMRPLVSGEEAKRYLKPETDTWIIFPYYQNDDGNMSLYSAEEMQKKAPMAWRYLRDHEKLLRKREDSAFDDTAWYRFGRNQNIDKQSLSKLYVAQTVQHLQVSCDANGDFALNNVRVNGIIPRRHDDMYFLLGVMNGKVADWVFRRIAKPKEGGYFEANKQFIAPLPVPRVDAGQRAEVAKGARKLEKMHSALRQLYADMERRLETCQWSKHKESLLWPELESFKGRGAADQRKARLEELKNGLAEVLGVEGELSVVWQKGELAIHVNNVSALDHVFIDETQGDLLAVAWRNALLVTPSLRYNIDRLVSRLCQVPASTNKALQRQLADLDARIAALRSDIVAAEAAMNERLFGLYNLNEEERTLVLVG